MDKLSAAPGANVSEDPVSSSQRMGNSLGSEARRAGLALLLIVLIALTVRLAFAALPRVVRWDEAAYQLIARNLQDGLGYRELVGASDLQQPPMVAYLSLAGRWLGLPTAWVTAGIVQVLLGALILLPVYGLAFELSGRRRRVGLSAALLAAVHPALTVSPLYWGTMTEPPYVLFILCGVYASWRLANAGGSGGGRWGWAAGLGIAFGLAYLTRPEAVAYLLLMLGFALLCRVWRQRAGPLRGRLRPALTSTLALALTSVVMFALVAAPYVVYVHRITGRWALSGKQGITIDIAWALVNHDQAAHDRAAASLDPAGTEIMWLSPAQYDRSLIGWVREDPRRFAWQVRRNIADTMQAVFHADLLSPLLVALVALGLFARPWTRSRLRRELLLWLALAPLASLWVFFVLSRFLAIVVPICLVWAAIGLAHLGDWVAATGANVPVPRPGRGGGRSRVLRSRCRRPLP